MVNSATSLGKNGLQDWLIQRITALLIIFYIAYLTFFWIRHPFDYDNLKALYSFTWMRYGTLLVLLSLLAHAWIGLWTILTDYVKVTFIRLILEVLFFIALFSFFIWGIQILWSQ